jgi:AraC family transcriptional regulator
MGTLTTYTHTDFEQMSQPDLSVTRIGINVGFNDTSSFSAAFRRQTGVTPTDFRRLLV